MQEKVNLSSCCDLHFIEIGEYKSVSWTLDEEGFVGGASCWSFGLEDNGKKEEYWV